MGYVFIMLLSIGYFCLFPNLTWDISISEIFNMKDSTIEKFLKNSNVVNQTSSDIASELISKDFLFTLIFFIMGCIIVHSLSDINKITNSKIKLKEDLEVEKTKIEEQKQKDIEKIKNEYEFKLKEKNLEITYLKAGQLVQHNPKKKMTKKSTAKNKNKKIDEEKE